MGKYTDALEEAVEDFCTRFCVRSRREEDGERIIPGRFGHIYAHGPDSNTFGAVLLSPSSSRVLDNTLRSRKRRALRAGFEIIVDGDAEGIFLFDLTNQQNANFAIRIVGVRKKRRQSPAQLANLMRGPEPATRLRLETKERRSTKAQGPR